MIPLMLRYYKINGLSVILLQSNRNIAVISTAVRAISKWCQISFFCVCSTDDVLCSSVQKKFLLPAKVTIEEGYSFDATVS